jgi:general secretion pathway protein D
MAAERQFQSRGYGRIIICAVAIVLSGSYLFAAADRGTSELARYRVFSLRHISAEQGKKYLAEAQIGTVSQLPSPNTLLVTAKPQELIKATAILKLVDTEEQFVIKAISPASEVENLPSNEQIAAEVGNISIGTFPDPPTSTSKTKAIIDVHEDEVIAIAPAGQVERIVSAIEQLQKAKAPTPRPSESDRLGEPEAGMTPEVELERAEAELERITSSSKSQEVGTEAEDVESDELFSGLLDLLAETEKVAARQTQRPVKPSEAAPVVTVPEQKEPSRPSRPEQIKEPTFQAARQPRQPQQVETVVKAPEVKEVAERPEPELQPEPAPGQVAVETERLGEEVVEPAPEIRSYEPEVTLNGNEMLELDLPQKLEIVDLLSLVGEYLHLDYMYDPDKVKGSVTLRLRGPIKVKDLYSLLESVLKFRGFVMTRKVNLVTIVPAVEALNIDPTLLSDEDRVRLGDVIITRVFRLKHINTASAQNLLTGMKLGASITPIPDTGTLIVTAYAYRMARVEELLQMVDKPGKPKQFKFRQLRYTMAETLAPKIKSLAEQLGTVSITISASAAARPERGRRPPAKPAPKPSPAAAKPTVYLDADERTNRILMIGLEEQLVVVEGLIDALDVQQQDLRTLRLYDIQYVGAEEVREKLGEIGIIGVAVGRRTTAARAAPSKSTKTTTPRITTPATREGLEEEPQVVIIESTNSLLVNATAEQHARVAMIIGYVDSETLELAIPYEIYSLENQDPEDLAEVLQKLIQETIKDKEGKVEKTIKKIEEDIVIVPDENTFSIIVYASKKNQEWIGKLIKKLDKRRPQVLIDVTLVEISRSDTFTYDLDIVTKFADLSPGGTMDKLTALLSPEGVGFPRHTITEATTTAGTGTGFYADRHIQAILGIMQQKGYGRVLAQPKILVNDNETGNINTENTTYVSRSASTTTTEGDPIISSSFTFDAFASGIDLNITPHISEGDLLRLEIQMTRSNQASAQTPGPGTNINQPPPDKTENKISTIVTVPDKSTIILGGILQLDQAKNGTKVPILGDIPLLGGLFRSTVNNSIDTKLYIFVKANILRPSETEAGLPELERISERKRAAFERAEREFQEYEDWPGVKPEPVDPLRVLEAE